MITTRYSRFTVSYMRKAYLSFVCLMVVILTGCQSTDSESESNLSNIEGHSQHSVSSPASIEDITGNWVGSVSAPMFDDYKVTLELEKKSGGSLKGTVYKYYDRKENYQVKYTVQGTFDEITREFYLRKTREDVERKNLRALHDEHHFRGVWDQNYDALAGVYYKASSGSLVLVREGQNLKKALAVNSFSSSRMDYRKLTNDVIEKWFEKYNEQRPHYQHGVSLKNNLLEDTYFSQFFGKTVDLFNQRDVSRFKERIHEYAVSISRTGRPVNTPTPSFLAFGKIDTEDFRRVYRDRVVRSWRDDRLQHLMELPLELNSFEKSEKIKFILNFMLKYSWPEELSNLNKAVKEANRKIALHLLNNSLAERFESASGVRGAKILSEWEDNNIELTKHIFESDLKRYQEKITNQIGLLIKPTVNQYVTAMPPTIPGIVGLIASNNWYFQFHNALGFVDKHPLYLEAIQKFSTDRELQFQSVLGEVEALLQSLNSTTDVSSIESNILVVNSDYWTASGRKISRIAKNQKQQIQSRSLAMILSSIGAVIAHLEFKAATESENRLSQGILGALRNYLIERALLNSALDITPIQAGRIRILLTVLFDKEMRDLGRITEEYAVNEIYNDYLQKYPDEKMDAHVFNLAYQIVRRLFT